MDVLKELEENLTQQSFDSNKQQEKEIANCLQIVKTYAEMEHCVAVMSDLIAKKSYISIGLFGHYLGLSQKINNQETINSIWEDEIYNKIHADDLFERHLLELKFFYYLDKLPPNERLKYSTSCQIRALDANGEYKYIQHRTRYLRSTEDGKLWLAICLYNFSATTPPPCGIDGKIMNGETGEIVLVEHSHYSKILTTREKEILKCVSQGLLSKEISDRYGISLNTVNRHRQNILEKMQVNNSMEAVRTAQAMNLI